MTVTTPEKRLVQQQVSKHKKVDKAIKKALDAHPSITTPVSTKKSQRRQVLKDRLYDGIDIERIVQGQTRSEILRLRGSTLTFSDCCFPFPWFESGFEVQSLQGLDRDNNKKVLTMNFSDGRHLVVKIDTDDAIDTIDTFKMLVEEKELETNRRSTKW